MERKDKPPDYRIVKIVDPEGRVFKKLAEAIYHFTGGENDPNPPGGADKKKCKKEDKAEGKKQDEEDEAGEPDVWVLLCRHPPGRRANPRCDTCRSRHDKTPAVARWAPSQGGEVDEDEAWEVCGLCEVEEFGDGAGDVLPGLL